MAESPAAAEDVGGVFGRGRAAPLGFRIVSARAADTYALRQAILRPHQRLDEVVFAGDDDPRATHLRAVDSAGTTIGVASLVSEATPWSGVDAWRLRGMATIPAARSRGVGRALLDGVGDVVADAGGGILWCAARLGAEGFYRRCGFVRIGDEWEEPAIGRHVAMWRDVAPRAT